MQPPRCAYPRLARQFSGPPEHRHAKSFQKNDLACYWRMDLGASDSGKQGGVSRGPRALKPHVLLCPAEARERLKPPHSQLLSVQPVVQIRDTGNDFREQQVASFALKALQAQGPAERPRADLDLLSPFANDAVQPEGRFLK